MEMLGGVERKRKARLYSGSGLCGRYDQERPGATRVLLLLIKRLAQVSTAVVSDGDSTVPTLPSIRTMGRTLHII